MHFRFTSEQEMFRAAIRDVLEGEAPRLAAVEDAAADTWALAARHGWLGVMLPEAVGGLGLGLCDTLVVQEEIGRALAPGPFATNLALFPAFHAAAARSGPLDALAAAIAAGDSVLVLAEPLQEGAPGKGADGKGAGGPASVLVEHPRLATHLALAAADARGLSILKIDGPEVSWRGRRPFDLTHPLGEFVDLPGLRIGALAGEAAVGRVCDAARIAACAEIVGICERTMERTVDYAGLRRQFDQPVGAFQAIKHRLADAFVQLENARTSVYYAAWAWDRRDPQASFATDMATACAGEMGSRLICDCIHVHGGIGFTWESGLHLCLRRVHRLANTLGTPRQARRAIAAHLLASVAADASLPAADRDRTIGIASHAG